MGITLQFAMVGTGIIKDPSAVEAMSRTGDRREILRGPLFYGLAFVVLTILFWRESPIGIVALMVLCGGDGLTDIVGQHMDSAALPWSAKKTVAGSVTMLLGGFILAFPWPIFSIYSAGGEHRGGHCLDRIPAICRY
jgi:phytol kinase